MNRTLPDPNLTRTEWPVCQVYSLQICNPSTVPLPLDALETCYRPQHPKKGKEEDIFVRCWEFILLSLHHSSQEQETRHLISFFSVELLWTTNSKLCQFFVKQTVDYVNLWSLTDLSPFPPSTKNNISVRFWIPMIPPPDVVDENKPTFKISTPQADLWGIYFQYTNFKSSALWQANLTV